MSVLIRNLKRVAKQILPSYSRRSIWLKQAFHYLGVCRVPVYSNIAYEKWIRSNERPGLGVSSQPRGSTLVLSLVIPFWNTPDRYLNELMESLGRQTCDNWELVMIDASDDLQRSAAIEKWSKTRDHYRYIKLKKNYDISTNTNKGIDAAKGEYIVFVDHDDVLSDNALSEVALAIEKFNPDILYSDEDKMTDDGKVRHSPYFKPDWSPHLFLFTNYTNHLSVVRKELVVQAGGLNKDYNGSQDYELLLRIHSMNEKQLSVHHIPNILYHWREAPSSTASGHSKKSYAYLAGLRALESYFERKHISVECQAIEGFPGYYKEVFAVQPGAKVKVIVSGESFSEKQRKDLIAHLQKHTASKRDVEYGANETSLKLGDVVIEIKKACIPTSPSWIDDLVGVSMLDDVASVSPRILDASGNIVLDAGRTAYREDFPQFRDYVGLRSDDHTPTGAAWWVRDVLAESDWAVVRMVRDTEPGNRQYHVVWSHVDFTAV